MLKDLSKIPHYLLKPKPNKKINTKIIELKNSFLMFSKNFETKIVCL